jgi:hypothetical protein
MPAKKTPATGRPVKKASAPRSSGTKERALKRSAMREAGRKAGQQAMGDPVSAWLNKNAGGLLKAVDNLKYEIDRSGRKFRDQEAARVAKGKRQGK